ncbi:MAG TPA: hypothetical protein PK129_06100 [Cellvibrionaceae bacterium]|nr:hypothetical protein [Cellvibrionaceae bacterium]
MSISIPASSLPAGTQSINAAIKTYDPNNAEDAQYFPGSYADSTGNGLVSVAFNFAQVTTNSGESLQALAENARIARQATSAIGYAAPAEPVIINRTIPTSSCATLKKLGDANAELAGFQIPVYTYNARAGLWDLLGYGTVYQQDGTAISADASSLDCTNGVYVLEIKVTNEIFLSEWWNLDYPLQFTAPKKRCANLQIVNEDQEPLAGVYGLIEGAGDFASSYFVSDAKGQAKVNVDIFAGDTTSAHYVVWDAIGGQGSITLSDTCPATSTQIIVIKRPQLCKIKGKIEYLNKPFGNIAIWAIASSETFLYQYYYVFGATNSEGIYNLDVACGVPYQPIVITAQDRELPMIAVDNQASADELSDDGSTSWVKPITFTELPFPTIFYSANYVANTQEGQLTFIGLHDAFPITYNLQVKNLVTGVEFASAMGSLEGNPDLADDIYGLALLRLGQLRVPLALPQDTSNISLIGTYTDGFGITTEVNQPLLILPTLNGNAQ